MPKKRRRRPDLRLQQEQDERLDAPPDLKPRAFVAKPCSMCTEFRPQQTNYSVVVRTVGRVRYCRCRYCSNTWTQVISADQISTCVVSTLAQTSDKPPMDVNANQHGNQCESTSAGRSGD